MPVGRAERAVEAPAKSIDGAEHSGMIKRVMAVADQQAGPRQVLRRNGAQKLVPITDRIWPQNVTLIAAQIAATNNADPRTIAAPRPPLSDAQAVV
jgi:hypothetical protein